MTHTNIELQCIWQTQRFRTHFMHLCNEVRIMQQVPATRKHVYAWKLLGMCEGVLLCMYDLPINGGRYMRYLRKVEDALIKVSE